MTAALILAALAVALLVPVIARAHRRWRDRPDLAWRPSSVTRTFDGHDETKAPIAAERAERESRAKLRLAVTRAGQTRSKKAADIYIMPKRGTR